MDKKYTITSSFALGDYDEKYGQTWMCEVREMDQKVMFNHMDKDLRVNIDDRLTFEEETIKVFKSGKNEGKEYRRLKKVQVHAGAISQTEQKQERTPDMDFVPEDVPDSVNLDDIPF